MNEYEDSTSEYATVDVTPELDDKDRKAGKLAFTTYRNRMVTAVNGDRIPPWEELNFSIIQAWCLAAHQVRKFEREHSEPPMWSKIGLGIVMMIIILICLAVVIGVLGLAIKFLGYAFSW